MSHHEAKKAKKEVADENVETIKPGDKKDPRKKGSGQPKPK